MSLSRLRDISAEIGPLYTSSPPTIPMYSFSRPAAILWQAVYDGMRDAGCTDKQATAWLQSKNPRWQLDNDLGDKLEALGNEFGALCATTAKELRV